MEKVTNAFDNQLLELCRQDRKLEAVKLCIEKMGMGLKESKDYVDGLHQKSEATRAASPGGNSLDQQLVELCRQTQYLQAIKLYIDTTGKGLKEGKEYVDALRQRHGL